MPKDNGYVLDGSTTSLIREAVPIFKLLLFWSAIATIPLFYHEFIDSSSVIGITAEYVGYFLLLLGVANVLLYILAQGITLARIDE